MTSIKFISDYFIDEINGGAEHYNDVLVSLLKEQYEIQTVKSKEVTVDFVRRHKDSFFVVANFFQLSDAAISELISGYKYAILEHDHKYSKTNNPSMFVNFLIPESHIINKKFFAAARAVLCQSRLHAEVVQKNLFINNVCSLGGNLWSEEHLSILEKNKDNDKNIDHGIMWTRNKNKGLPAAIDYCEKNGLEYEFLYNKPFGDFIEELSRVKKLIFFPQWLESYSRVAVEAKILGCKLVSNGLLGVASEDYFKQSGQELLNTIRTNNRLLCEKWASVIDGENIQFLEPIEVPKVTILGTIYDGDKYIEQFLENIVNQTIFNRCELILIDANSPGNEQEVISRYTKKHDNIIYKRLSESFQKCVFEYNNYTPSLFCIV